MTSAPASARWQHLPRGMSALRHRNFRLFYGGQLISLPGTWIQQVAQGWLVLELTNDPFALGLVAAAQFVPVMILGLFGGVAADALPKRKALIATQLADAVLALVLGLLVLLGDVQVGHVLLLALLLGIVNAFDMPIRQAFVVEMVGRADVGGAIALNSALFNAARIVGPAVAGIVIGIVGLAPCFLINAASYVPVIVGLLLMRTAELHGQPLVHLERSVRSIIDQLAEGLRYVWSTPVILLPIAIVGIVATAAFNFQVLMPLVARDLLGGGAETYGFLMAASGVGSLLSALALAAGRRPSLSRVVVGAITAGLAVAAVGVSHVLPLSLLLMGLAGWGLITMAATTNMIVQMTVPDSLRGRAMSVYTTVFAGSTPVGGLVAGAIAGMSGVGVALVLGGLVSAGAAGLALRTARALDQTAALDVGGEAPALNPPVREPGSRAVDLPRGSPR
jgi:MFS family permease